MTPLIRRIEALEAAAGARVTRAVEASPLDRSTWAERIVIQRVWADAADRAGVPRAHCGLLESDRSFSCTGERVEPITDAVLDASDRALLSELPEIAAARTLPVDLGRSEYKRRAREAGHGLPDEWQTVPRAAFEMVRQAAGDRLSPLALARLDAGPAPLLPSPGRPHLSLAPTTKETA
jgi:hypothetical protein